MNDNIHYLYDRPREIAHYVRVGFREHRRCEHLLSAGKLPVQRFVIEAGNFERQAGLVRSLLDENAEIVLDTNAAELSVKGRFEGSVKSAPWAADGRPLDREDFAVGTNRSVIGPIARFAVEKKVSAVMAPTHFLGEAGWFDTDVRSCAALRESLDRFGGDNIAIDYPLIPSYAQFRDPAFRARIIEGLKDAPFDYLWLRVAGFGADATAAGIERYIQGVFEFHELGRPVIADQVGGLASIAACAFGASSGFAHGTEGKERFATTGWLNPSGRKSGGGGGKKIYIAGLDRRLKVSDARKLFEEARTSREIFGCPDRTCCGDIEKMLKNPEAHLMVQKGRQVRDLSLTPESLRAERFLTGHLEQARLRADRATRLKKTDDAMKSKIVKAGKRLELVEETLVNLHEQLGPVEFAQEAELRRSRGVRRSVGVEELRP